MQIATCRSGFENVVVKRCPFMQSERESGGFLQCKSIAYTTLELVDRFTDLQSAWLVME